MAAPFLDSWTWRMRVHDLQVYLVDIGRSKGVVVLGILYSLPKHWTLILQFLMIRLMGKPTMWFPNRSDTNRPVQL